MLTRAITILKRARKAEAGEITSPEAVIALLEAETLMGPRHHYADSQSIRERISVLIDALAFHAGEVCDKPETIYGVMTMLSEIRHALDRTYDND